MDLKLRYKRKFYENAFETLKADGTYPPELMKAVFVSGGFGSNKLFNPEIFSAGYDLKLIEKGKPISNYSKDLSLLEKPSKDLDDLDYLRAKAEQIKGNLDTNYIDARLGLIMDCTETEVEDLVPIANKLVELGYDVLVVYLKTMYSGEFQSLTATNNFLHGDLIEYYIHEETKYISYFNSFKYHKFRDFEDVVIQDYLEAPNILKFESQHWIFNRIQEFINNPIINPLSKKWIDQQLDKYEPII